MSFLNVTVMHPIMLLYFRQKFDLLNLTPTQSRDPSTSCAVLFMFASACLGATVAQ